MAISPTHSEAARQNGAQSHGPATPEGRTRSSQNARKHDIFASLTLLSQEDQDRFYHLSNQWFDHFQPQDVVETRLVREMVDAEWRLTLVREHSAKIQYLQMLEISPNPTPDTAALAFRQLADQGHVLSLALRYETQFRRQFDKAFQQLRDYRRQAETDAGRQRKADHEEQLRFYRSIIEAPIPGELEDLGLCGQPPQKGPEKNDDAPAPSPEAQPQAATPDPEPAPIEAATPAEPLRITLQNEPNATLYGYRFNDLPEDVRAQILQQVKLRKGA